MVHSLGLQDVVSYARAIPADIFSSRVLEGNRSDYWIRKGLDYLDFSGVLPEACVRQVAPRGTVTVETSEGFFPVRLGTNDIRLASSFYEHRFRDFIPEGGESMLDVGANIGLYAVRAANKDISSIHAFEPDTENRRLLERTLNLNDILNRVTVREEVVADRHGYVQFNQKDFHKGRGEIDGDGDRVKATTLDSYIKASKLRADSLSYVKVDVEGGVGKVLDGAERMMDEMLSGSRLHVEFLDESAYRRGDDLLTNLGFTRRFVERDDYLYEKE